MTGTPIQNSLQDVYALIKFLRHEPWCESGFWKAAITNASAEASDDEPKSTKSNGPDGAGADISSQSQGSTGTGTGTSVALGRVKRLLAPIILRRTKDSLTKDG